MSEGFNVLSHPAWGLVVSWLLTYGLHSTILLGGVWVIGRVCDRMGVSWPDPAWRELFWKAALAGGVATSALSVAGVGASPVAVELPATGVVPVSADGGGIEGTGYGILRSLPLAGIAGAAWLVGVVVLGVRKLWSRRTVLRALAERKPVVEGRVNGVFADLYEEGAHGRVPSISAASSMPGGPVALWTDEICLPEWLIQEAPTDQIESVLAHELAHLRRRDPLWLQFAMVLEAVFFFQPLNRVGRGRLEHLFECRCDREVVRLTGRRRPLAEVLLQVARHTTTAGAAPSIGIAGRSSGLTERISRLGSPMKNESPDSSPHVRALVVGCVLVLLAGFGPVVAPGGAGSSVVRSAARPTGHAAEFERLVDRVAPSDRPLVRRLLEHHAREHHHHSSPATSRSEAERSPGGPGE